MQYAGGHTAVHPEMKLSKVVENMKGQCSWPSNSSQDAPSPGMADAANPLPLLGGNFETLHYYLFCSLLDYLCVVNK